MTENIEFPAGDYVSPGFVRVRPDAFFPNMVVGNVTSCPWPYLRRTGKHNWYVDSRVPTVGFVSRDEAHILYNCALAFAGMPALEIGCWLGWSACHLLLAGVTLDVIDPVVENEGFRESIFSSLNPACTRERCLRLIAGKSPERVHQLAEQGTRWSLVYIDGEHEFPGPVNDAVAVERYCATDALVLFHDLLSPHVAEGLRYLKDRGWHTKIFHTMQIMGAAWRGNVIVPDYVPDAAADWAIPEHLKDWA